MIFVRSMFSQRGGVGYTIFYCNQLSIPVKFISFAEIFSQPGLLSRYTQEIRDVIYFDYK